MKRILIIISITLLIGIAVITASKVGMNSASNNTGQSDPAAKEDIKPATNEVFMSEFSFSPSKITVKKGTTITWVNQDTARHDITPDNPEANFKASKLLAKGESHRQTFDNVGSYSYHCSPHPYMKAVVEVTE